MQTKVLYLSDLKFNLETWKRELQFHFNEMDTFEKKLEEIAQREYGEKAMKPLEVFQNRIIIEKRAISKLLERIKNKTKIINNNHFDENGNFRFQSEPFSLKDDMRTYIKLHYELKEEMMDYFLEWL